MFNKNNYDMFFFLFVVFILFLIVLKLNIVYSKIHSNL